MARRINHDRADSPSLGGLTRDNSPVSPISTQSSAEHCRLGTPGPVSNHWRQIYDKEAVPNPARF